MRRAGGNLVPCTVTVGGFFGDEGKGKLVAYLAYHDKPAIVARGGVGPNAGHTVEFQEKKYSLRMIPSGFVYEKARLLIGPGVSVKPSVLLEELEQTSARKRTGVDEQCGIIEDRHVQMEVDSIHLSGTLGSTKSGVGACNSERALRSAKLARDIPELRDLITNVSDELHTALEKEQNVLLEGTQGTFLSLYHGTYPYCTSKDTIAAAVCSDVGIGPTDVDDVIAVFKAFVTRVGTGPLSGELSPDEAKSRGWQEYGTVTGRPRRAAAFDFDLAKKSVKLNGATQIALTKLDATFPATRSKTRFGELPKEAQKFVEKVEEETGVVVTLIGTGPAETDIIDRRDET